MSNSEEQDKITVRDYYKLDDGSMVSTKNRFCQDVAPVAAEIPKDDQIFCEDQDGIPRIEIIREHFRFEGRLTESQVMRILRLGTALLASEDNLLRIPAPLISKFPNIQCFSK